MTEQNADSAGYDYVGNPYTVPTVIIEQYRLQAADYDASMTKWGYAAPAQSVDVLRRHLPSEAVILEVGCGTGLADELHYRAGFTHLHGVDLSPDMLAVARAKNIHEQLMCENILDGLSSEPKSFDAAVCIGVLTHFLDAEPVLREMIRVVRSGGKVIFTQRNDIYQRQGMKAMIARLEGEGLITLVEQTEWSDYCSNHQAYIDGDIKAAFFVCEVK